MSPEDVRRRLRVAELYCGIGGCAVALRSLATVIAGVDINREALEVYRWNLPHPTAVATLEGLAAEILSEWRADLWWMSPPCQPFTRRGLQQDAHDSRTRSFLALLDHFRGVQPRYLAIENVPGFRGSITHATLRETLDRLDYQVREWTLCPTALGVPNRRERYYLVASRTELKDPMLSPAPLRPLRAFLDPAPSPMLRVDPELVHRYWHAMDIVDPEAPAVVAACFTSAYGHSPVRSGSYLETPDGLRRFSPGEILRLLGFPATFTLPPRLPLALAWRLVGNSLSIPAVRHVLSAIPELSALGSVPTDSRHEESERRPETADRRRIN